MNSRKTFFNKTIYCKNVMRLWPVWGLLSFIALILSVASFRELNQNAKWDPVLNFNAAVKNQFYTVAVEYNIIIIFVYAVIIGAVVWGYLTTQRGVVFAHSLPASRGCLFVSTFLSGITVVYVPILVYGVSYFIGTAVCGRVCPGALLTFLWISLAYTVIFFSIETFVAMLTGTKASNVILHFIINFIFYFIEAIITNFRAYFMYGIVYRFAGKLDFLSPERYLMDNVTVYKVYEDVEAPGVYTYYSSDIKDIAVRGQKYVLIYTVAMLLLLGLSYLIYLRRKSERATEVVAFSAVREVLLYVLVLIVGTWGTMQIYALFDNGQDLTYIFCGVLAASIVAVSISFFIIRMIMDKTIKVFCKKNIICWACALAVFFAMCLFFAADPTGAAKIVPEESEIEEIEFCSNETTYYIDKEDTYALEGVINLHKAILAEGERRYIETDEDDGRGDNYIRIEYTLKNGETVFRDYHVPMFAANMSDPNSLENKYDEFLNLRPILEKKYLLDIPKTDNEYVEIYYYREDGNVSTTLWDEDYQAFENALREDLKQGCLRSDNIFDPDYSTKDDFNVINASIRKISNAEHPGEWGGMEHDIDKWTSFTVDSSMVNTYGFLACEGYIPVQ